MTASYSTIPADVDSSAEPLLNNKPKFSLKRVVGAAAVVSFCLGAVAAASLTSPGAPIKKLARFEDLCYDDEGGKCCNAMDPWNNDQMCDRNDQFYVSFMDSIACTPYAYAPVQYPEVDDKWDADDAFKDILLMGDVNGQGAWGNDDREEFFVFHGADGSGTQSDCEGENGWYAERFGRPYKHKLLNKDGKKKHWKEGDDFYDVEPKDGICWKEAEGTDYERQYCSFVHPGSKTFYTDYYSGWATKPEGDIAHQVDTWTHVSKTEPWQADDFREGDCGDLGSSYSGCYTEEYIQSFRDETSDEFEQLYNEHQDKFFSFQLLPWICDDGPNNNYFSAPTRGSTGTECYADNEAPHNPPYNNLYYGYFDWNPVDGATLTMNYKQFAADGSVIQGYKNHVFYPVTTADDDRVW